MKEINWNIFETKFNGKQQAAFQRMAYGLFCTRFNQENGIVKGEGQLRGSRYSIKQPFTDLRGDVLVSSVIANLRSKYESY